MRKTCAGGNGPKFASWPAPTIASVPTAALPAVASIAAACPRPRRVRGVQKPAYLRLIAVGRRAGRGRSAAPRESSALTDGTVARGTNSETLIKQALRSFFVHNFGTKLDVTSGESDCILPCCDSEVGKVPRYAPLAAKPNGAAAARARTDDAGRSHGEPAVCAAAGWRRAGSLWRTRVYPLARPTAAA